MIDQLRSKMHVTENKQFSQDYLDPEKRSISNAIQITFKDGAGTDLVTVEYPVGHKRRRAEGIPLLVQKFKAAVAVHYGEQRASVIVEKFLSKKKLLGQSIEVVLSDLHIAR